MRNIFKILFFFSLIFSLVSPNYASDTEKDYIEEGDFLLQKIENNENPELNSMYLKNALYNFYVASKKTPPSTEALIGLGRVYLQMDKLNDAKYYLFEAYSIDKYNADANFYFAELNYKYNDYETALKYYQNAYFLSYKDRTKNIEMIIKCYNKLGDEQGIIDFQNNIKN